MKDRDSVPELLEPLRNGPIGVSTPEQIEAERRTLLPWLEGRIAELPFEHGRYLAARRRRRAQRIAGSAMLAAAAGALLFWGWQAGETAEQSARGSENAAEAYATLVSGRLSTGKVEILPGSRLGAASLVQSSEDAAAVLRGSSGYVAELSPGGQLALGAPGVAPERQELRLERGQVRLTVPKLERGATLSVLTEDARVIVRGTEFAVALQEDEGEGGGTGALRRRTCVRVTEGAVEVHRRGSPSVLLGPGEESGCEDTRAQAPEGPRGRSSRNEARPSRKTPARGSASPPKLGTLEQESELLASALSAEQRGDYARARRELKVLLRRYPQSPLANEARAALGRVER